MSEDFANITSLDWSANGVLADAGSGISIYDGDSLQLTRYWDIDGMLFLGSMFISWNQDGTKIVVANKTDQTAIGILDVATGNILRTFEVTDMNDLRDLDWSPDGNKIVIVGGQKINVFDATKLPEVFGTPTATYFPTTQPSLTPTLSQTATPTNP